ncbi:MAG: hypothetical protein L6R38_005040 [Xanthoria sp. 2 TBL-2021]|nr:MAG: hypothetical protein L6R38_005040 [Xanthoria sp. 2 TBL-2021]
MATQQRPPASRMSVGGNILSRMLQLEKQSKQHRNPSPNLAQSGNSNPLNMNPSVAVVPSAASAPSARPIPQKAHAPVSAAAVRQSRSVPPAPAPQATTSPNQRPQSSPKPASQLTQETPSHRPSTMPRSQTVPALSIDVIASEANKPKSGSKPGPEGDEESVTSEICVSPSWSDFGGAKRKKEKKRFEKERKEEEKKLKEEAKQKAAELKAGKRLSKRPPPAAMETQKMPSALRRNSIISYISSHSSGENSRSHSRDRKRLSVASIDSSNGNERSQSTPGTSTELRPGSSEDWNPVVSPVAPQLPRLPRLGWHSRSGSSGTDKSRSWGSDDQYEKELVNFAYQIQAPAKPSALKDIVLSNVKVDQVSVQHPSQRQSGAWPITRSQTDSELAKINGTLKVKNMEQRPPVPNRESSGDSTAASVPMGNRSSHLDKNETRPKSRDPLNDIHNTGPRPEGDEFGRTPAAKMVDRLRGVNAPAAQKKPGFDGNSYVHKQRMHQQQLSIAGFEDEQAVRIANEMRVEEEESAPEEVHEAAQDTKEPDEAGTVPQRQPEPLKPQPETPQNSPPTVETKIKPQEPAQRPNQTGQGIKESRKSTATAPSPTSRNSTMDKLLGFKRRQRPEPGTLSLSGNAVALDKKGPKSPPPPKDTAPPPVPSAKGKLESVKAQKAIEATSKAQQNRRSESVEVVGPQKKTEEPKPAPTQSHSRTRTSSSQLLNEDLNLSRPLPRSTTAPVLSPDMKLPSALSDRSRAESPSTSERKSVTFERSVSDSLAEMEKQNKAPAKAPEIVVETVSPEGLVRTTSIKRPRSNPNLQVGATNAPNLQLAASQPQLPSLDFLPQLKHQPLPKRDPNRASFMASPDRPASSQFPASSSVALKPTPNPLAPLPLSSSSPNLANVPGAMLRPESYAGPSSPAPMTLQKSPHHVRRRTMSPSAALSRTSIAGAPNVFGHTPTPSESVNAKPMAKLFVICCKCKYWHDLPSHLYEAMCTPKDLTRDPEGKGAGPKVLDVKDGKKKMAEATLETMVKCPWCEHFMTTRCCAGWTAVLYLQERHH